MARRLLTPESLPLSPAIAEAAAAAPPVPTGARLIMIRAATSDGADRRVVELCAAHGLPQQAINVAGRTGDGVIIAIEVPASRAAASGMLEPQLLAIAGVQTVTVTHVGVSTRHDVVHNRI